MLNVHNNPWADSVPVCCMKTAGLQGERGQRGPALTGGVHHGAIRTCGIGVVNLSPSAGSAEGPADLQAKGTALCLLQEVSEQCISVAGRSGHAHRDIPCVFWNV